MSNPFEIFKDMEEVVAPGDIPIKNGLVAVVQEAGVKTFGDNDKLFMYLDLYFPEYNNTKSLNVSMINTKGAWGLVCGVLSKLGISTDKANRHLILEKLQATKGWTLEVDHYLSRQTDKNGDPYKNLRISKIIQKTEEEIPF